MRKFKTDEAAKVRKAEILEQIFSLSRNLDRLKKNHPAIFAPDDDIFIENIGRSALALHLSKEGKSCES